MSEWAAAILGATLGHIASAAATSTGGGLGVSRVVYIEMKDGRYVLINCPDDYYRYIKKWCPEGKLDSKAEKAIITKLKDN